MPDKYEFRRYAGNLNHPWFTDIKLDFQQLSLNRILLCILCILLMNIDDNTFSTHSKLSHNINHTSSNTNNSHTLPLPTDAIILYNQKELILSNTKSHHKQCNKQKFPFQYLGSKAKNVFHTQLMIGVIFSFIMQCRIPILFSFINIIIRSGCSFKPKIIPMFIDSKTLKPETFYGSSYKLLHTNTKFKLLYMENIEDDHDSSSEDESECEDYYENENKINYDFIHNELPKHLFGE